MIDDYESASEESWYEEDRRREELWSRVIILSAAGFMMTALTLTAMASNSTSFVLFPKNNLPVLALRVLLFGVAVTSSLGLFIGCIRHAVIVFGWKCVSAFAVLAAVCAASLLTR